MNFSERVDDLLLRLREASASTTGTTRRDIEALLDEADETLEILEWLISVHQGDLLVWTEPAGQA